MDFTLPDEAAQLEQELARWVAKRSERLGEGDGFDAAGWKELVAFGLPGLTSAGGTEVELVVALMEAARAGLPGPVVEAQLALDSGSADAAQAIQDGKVVTSVALSAGDRSIVPWGAVADLVVDQATGATLATGPLPPVRGEYPLPHGWLEHAARDAGPDPLLPRRWLLTAAVMTGLARGALGRTTQHAVDRHQFGRPLASFQAVQFRLAECLNLLEGMRLCVLDAAWRAASGRADADLAAALTWLWAGRAAEQVGDHCHQVYGALGFCDETGLVALTAPLTWYRLAGEHDRAVRFVTDRRARQPGVPHSRVMPGFVTGR
jgi:Acyl-CoA dehydrogenase, C-terminal domain